MGNVLSPISAPISADFRFPISPDFGGELIKRGSHGLACCICLIALLPSLSFAKGMRIPPSSR